MISSLKIVMLTIALLAANIASAEPSLLEIAPTTHHAGQPLVLTPKPAHHFNLKAPNQCGTYQVTELSASRFSCRPTEPGPLKIMVAICDEKETFCKIEWLDINVTS